MSHIRLAILVVSLAVPGAAHAADGAVYLYVQPLRPDASRVSFTITAAAAVTQAGSEYPLKVNLATVGKKDVTRQRLLASGRLPAGSYSGILLTIGKATITTDTGEADLVLPDAPVRIDLPLGVAADRAALFWLSLDRYDGAPGAPFNPPITVVTPAKAYPDHAGFVSNAAANTITVFDKNLGQAVAAIATCAGPRGLALDTRRRRLYVACERDDEIQSIDAVNGEIIERTRVSPGDRPRELALSPDGFTLLAVNPGSNSVSFYEAASLTRQDRVTVGSAPSSVLVEPGGGRAFVFNTLSNSVSVLDLRTRSVAATISTDGAPVRGKLNRAGDRLYVIQERSPYLTVLDTRQLTAVARARLRAGATALEVDAVRDLVCIGSSDESAIDFYDPNTLLPLYSMKTPAAVSYLTSVPVENSLYVVSADTRSVMIARLGDRRIVAQIDVGEAPYWLAAMGEK